jgi:hypothetical protein
MKLDTDEVRSITNPLEQALAADTAMDDARQAMSELSEIRIGAIRKLVNTLGGAVTADALNVARPTLYRALRAGVSSDELDRDEVYWQREAQRLNAQLRKTGRNAQQINAWWNLTTFAELGNRTPMKAWSDGDRVEVLRLMA